MENTKKAAVLMGAFALSAALLACTAHAQPVQVTGEPVPIPVKGTEEEKVVNALQFDVYGSLDAETVALRIEGNNVQADKDTFMELLPLVDLDTLPDASGWTDLTRGSRGTEVQNMQQNLINLGFLTGSADGAYGSGTEGGVSAFQSANNLEPTGIADVYTQMAIQGAADGTWSTVKTVSYPPVYTAEDKFSSVLDLTDKDLTPFVHPSWKFHYDRMKGEGSLDIGIPAGSYQIEQPAIDRIQLDASFKVILSGTNELAVIPALYEEAFGAYRPYLVSAVLTEGSSVCRLSGAQTTGELDGITIRETGYLPLTEEAVQFLKDNESFTLILEGANNTYEFRSQPDRDKMDTFLEAVSEFVE